MQRDSENLIFLDECGFSNHTLRTYGYSRVGTGAFVDVKANRGRNASLMCAIGIDGVIASEVKEGSFNADSFDSFIRAYLIDYFRENPGKCLLMDNVAFHHKKTIVSLLCESGIEVIFLPAYSPQLNPIEEFFAMFKSRYRRTKDRKETARSCVEKLLKVDYSDKCPGFFSHMKDWLEKALKHVAFY